MTRSEILSRYNVRSDGIIVSPGQFEGEMLYVPYFWEAYLNGFADRDDGTTLDFDLSPEDKVEFPELKGRRTVRLQQSSQGFVHEV